jgi:hypothetical protein
MNHNIHPAVHEAIAQLRNEELTRRALRRQRGARPERVWFAPLRAVLLRGPRRVAFPSSVRPLLRRTGP